MNELNIIDKMKNAKIETKKFFEHQKDHLKKQNKSNSSQTKNIGMHKTQFKKEVLNKNDKYF